MSQSIDDLKAKADWDGAEGASRHQLLSDLSSKLWFFAYPKVGANIYRMHIPISNVTRTPARYSSATSKAKSNFELSISQYLDLPIIISRSRLPTGSFPQISCEKPHQAYWWSVASPIFTWRKTPSELWSGWDGYHMGCWVMGCTSKPCTLWRRNMLVSMESWWYDDGYSCYGQRCYFMEHTRESARFLIRA